jgi:thioester reductase-like protein
LSSILITGATGFLGSHFLLRSQVLSINKIYCLVRGDNVEHSRERVIKALHLANEGYAEKYRIEDVLHQCIFIPADIESDFCGVDDAILRNIRESKIHSVWHFAASLNYEDDKSDLIEKRNVLGTHNIISLSEKVNCNTFVYISTAYVAGKNTGDIKESLNPVDGEFNNYYEYSKNTAENLVSDLCADKGLNYRIMRPSIVIGPKSTMKPAGSTTGLYGLLKLMRQMARIVNNKKQVVRIRVKGESKLNFIPVDKVVDDAFTLFDQNFSGGPIYHITADDCLTFNQCKDVFETLMDVELLNFVENDIIEPSPLELIIQKKMIFYNAYINSSQQFERTLTSHNGINKSEFEQYCISALNRKNANI